MTRSSRCLPNSKRNEPIHPISGGWRSSNLPILEEYSQQLAAIWSILTIAFELILLDALVSQMFIQNCPNRITEWEDYLIAPMPIAQRVAAIATYTVFPLIVVGYLAGTSANKLVLTFADGVEKETNADRSVYAILYQARIVLRSLAARRESGTYAYCSTILYAIVIEIHTVVIPAYLIFVAPAIVMFGYDNAPASAAPRRPAPHTQLLAGRLSCACRRCTTSPSSSSSCK